MVFSANNLGLHLSRIYISIEGLHPSECAFVST